MSKEIGEAALAAAMRVFETATFMSVRPADKDEAINGTPDVAATMTFHGAREGRMTLRVCRQVLAPLVENMLGEIPRDEEAEEKGQDALNEILNMICGNALTEWMGEECIFDLSPPQSCAIEALAEEAHAAAETICFNLEDTRAEIAVEEFGTKGAGA